MGDTGISVDAQARRGLWVGLGWMALSMGSFIGMSIGSRELAVNLSIRQVLFFRALVGLFVIVLFMRSLWPEIRQMRQFRLQLIRNTVHFTAQYFWTIGVVLMPLASVFALEFTMPVWVAFFAWAILHERPTRARLLAVLGGFMGVLVIVRPGTGIVDPAAGLVLIAAMGYGLSLVLVKLLTRQNLPGVIVAWMILIQLPLGLVAALTDWRPVHIADLPWMILAGAGALSAHYCMAQALRRLDASVAIPVDFLRVPPAAIVGYLFYHEAIDIWVFAGAAIILFSNLRALRAERVR